MMKKIRATFFDADGVLIKGGRFDSTPAELKEAVAELRESGVLFNLASGRPLFEQEELFRIITGNAEPKPLEGILYEASAVKLWGDDQRYKVGGLNIQQIEDIEAFIICHSLFNGMVPQANNRKYETQLGYVTPTFRSKGKTDKQLLKTVYHQVKPIIEAEFTFAQVGRSADAVDIMAKGTSKDKPTLEYSRITGIPLMNTAAIGDSDGDLPMLREVMKAGGRAAYVGEMPGHIIELTDYGNWFIKTNQFGPLGTVEFIREILKHNEMID